jgi:hypothetical protein
VLASTSPSQTKPASSAQTKPEAARTVVPASNINQPAWLRGVWEGTGYQTDDNSTWSIRLTVTQQKGRGRVYSIDYPSLNCGGRWKLLSMSSNQARFREQITRGQDKCSQNGLVVLERKGRRQSIFLYSNEGTREITASAVLNRKKRTQSSQ